MSIFALWLPIIVSAVIVFVASALVWMVMPWHRSDWHRTGNEQGIRSALKGSAAGEYLVPYGMDPAELKKPELQEKYIEGPVAYIRVVPSGLPTMGSKLVLSFVYYLLVGVLCAYLVSRTLPGDAPYLDVFQVAGTVAWIAYGVAYIQDSIWFGKPWSNTLKNLFDALIYGLLTGGTFGWLA